jgi:hypothetical protein
MKSSQIKVGDDYVYQSYGDYEPRAWRAPSWRSRTAYKVKVVGDPTNGKVLIQHVPAAWNGFATEGNYETVSTRRIFATWAEHTEAMAEATLQRIEHLRNARKDREAREPMVKRLEWILNQAGVDHVSTPISVPYARAEEVQDVADHLAELGFIVSIDRSIFTADAEEEWVRGESAYYAVASPGDVASLLYGKTALTLTANQVLGIYDAGSENA